MSGIVIMATGSSAIICEFLTMQFFIIAENNERYADTMLCCGYPLAFIVGLIMTIYGYINSYNFMMGFGIGIVYHFFTTIAWFILTLAGYSFFR